MAEDCGGDTGGRRAAVLLHASEEGGESGGTAEEPGEFGIATATVPGWIGAIQHMHS